MKEKHRYHFWDFVNLTIFYSVFICFLVSLIIGIVEFGRGNLAISKLIYRFVLLLLLCVPFLVKKLFKISFSCVVGIVYYAYMFLAGFLGVVLELYVKLSFWDMIIHFLMGMCVAVLSIYVLNVTVYKKDRSRHNKLFTYLFMVSFTMAICAIWEIGEFVFDLIFNMGYQRYVTYAGEVLIGQAALFDTMIDLCFGFGGAIVGVIFTIIAQKIDNNFLKTFHIKKMHKMDVEVEDIEE
ncbi:MAG: hypothetical protein E7376_01515 [Clostridiales bacterium]|nr:hypothetical protein [Clostridiales bacterium]